MSTGTLTVTPSAFEFEQVFNDESFRDSAGGVWASGRNGNRWRLTLTFNNLTGAERRALWAHVAQLRGQRNRLQVNMVTLGYVRAGAFGGTPVTDGTQAAGSTSWAITGATPGVTNWIAAGDFISISNELKMCTQNADSDGSGDVVIPIWPETHTALSSGVGLSYVTVPAVFFLIEAQGLGAVPHPSDDSGTPWLSPTVTLVLEEDVYA